MITRKSCKPNLSVSIIIKVDEVLVLVDQTLLQGLWALKIEALRVVCQLQCSVRCKHNVIFNYTSLKHVVLVKLKSILANQNTAGFV